MKNGKTLPSHILVEVGLTYTLVVTSQILSSFLHLFFFLLDNCKISSRSLRF